MTDALHPRPQDSSTPHGPPKSRAAAESGAAGGHLNLRTVEPNSWRSTFPLLGLLSSLLAIEIVTGALLMFYYSPAVQTAWGSVWYIETQADFGWLIRGVHRIASDALIVAAALSIVLALATRAYRPPRHAVWYASIAVFLLSMALAISGRTLPWDQHAYWGTVVRTNIAAKAPIVGETIRTLILGGSEPGQFTLTRFFTSHTLILPAILGLLFWTLRRDRQTDVDQRGQKEAATRTSRAAVRWALMNLCLVALLIWLASCLHSIPRMISLAAPADPESIDYPARPEWFNLFLFQWLKGFHGPTAEVFGAIVLPTLILFALLTLPRLARRVSTRAGHRIAWTLCGGIGAGMVVLTLAATRADRPPDVFAIRSAQEKVRSRATLTEAELHAIRAWEFQTQSARADVEARRATELAEDGIPASGPLELLRNDPLTRGPRLFAEHCAACHRFAGHDGLGTVPASPATSSDLAGVGSATWVRSLLENPMSERHFGLMKTPEGAPAHTRMARWIREQKEESESALGALFADFDAVAVFLSSESPRPVESTDAEKSRLDHGRSIFFERCNECHSYDGKRSGTFHAPEMKGYASVEWLERMIADAGHESLYRREGKEPARMPAFADRLTPAERSLIAKWLRDARP